MGNSFPLVESGEEKAGNDIRAHISGDIGKQENRGLRKNVDSQARGGHLQGICQHRVVRQMSHPRGVEPEEEMMHRGIPHDGEGIDGILRNVGGGCGIPSQGIEGGNDMPLQQPKTRRTGRCQADAGYDIGPKGCLAD